MRGEKFDNTQRKNKAQKIIPLQYLIDQKSHVLKEDLVPWHSLLEVAKFYEKFLYLFVKIK